MPDLSELVNWVYHFSINGGVLVSSIAYNMTANVI